MSCVLCCRACVPTGRVCCWPSRGLRTRQRTRSSSATQRASPKTRSRSTASPLTTLTELVSSSFSPSILSVSCAGNQLNSPLLLFLLLLFLLLLFLLLLFLLLLLPPPPLPPPPPSSSLLPLPLPPSSSSSSSSSLLLPPPSSLLLPLPLPPSSSSSSSSSPIQDHSGQLDKNEYRACLLSLGYKLGSDPVSAILHMYTLYMYIS